MPDSSSYAGIDFSCPDCSGTAPATSPKFWFKSTVVYAASGGSPRMVVRFSDGGSMDIRPLAWTGAWQLVDGSVAGSVDNNGGSCGFVYGTDYAGALACHPGATVTAIYIVTDSGWMVSPYTHLIDDVQIGSSNFSTCDIEPSLSSFRDDRRAPDINVGLDLGGTGETAINFTGTAGSGGDSWITVYEGTPVPTNFGNVSLRADVQIHRFNNKKGAGLFALYNEVADKKGLALIIYNAGNTDTLVLNTLDQGNGKLVPIATTSLGAGILEDKWYRLEMDVVVSGANVTVTGKVFRHVDPSDADSGLDTQVGTTLSFAGARPAGVDATGEIGIVASAVSAVVDSSVTNFAIE